MPGRATTTSHPRTGAGPRAGRGSIYSVVLAMAILVSLIGLSAVAVGRINLRTAAAGGDAVEAEGLALSAVENVTTLITTKSNWRSLYQNDTPSAALRLGDGTLQWKLVDETDGSLATGGLQPVRVFGFGRSGVARRAFSVRFVPSGNNLLSNTSVESGTSAYQVQSGDCLLDAPTDDPHWGTKYLRVRSRTGSSAGPQQDVTSKVSQNRSYYIEAWVKMSTSADRPVFSLVVKKSSGGSDDTFTAKALNDLGKAAAVGTEWTRVNATMNVPTWSGTAGTISLRFGTLNTSQDFKLDDVKLIDDGSPTAMAPSTGTWQQEPWPQDLP